MLFKLRVVALTSRLHDTSQQSAIKRDQTGKARFVRADTYQSQNRTLLLRTLSKHWPRVASLPAVVSVML